ncbi:MAG: argininosuccinate synthase, partial [Halolamina sp.]
IYDWTASPANAPASETVTIEFDGGYPTTVDGESHEPVSLIETLNELAGAHGVGRTDVMEDRMLGLKVRENYEHPAATVLLTAHEALEGLVLTKEQRAFKRTVDDAWAQKAYEGLVSTPLVESLEAFVDATQERVTGSVTVALASGGVRPVARESPYAVYSADAASFDTEDVGDIEQADATGVAKYHGYQARLAGAIGAGVEESDSDPAMPVEVAPPGSED